MKHFLPQIATKKSLIISLNQRFYHNKSDSPQTLRLKLYHAQKLIKLQKKSKWKNYNLI